MTFESLKPPKISDTIAHELEQLIIEGVLKPGEKLPPERELAQQFEVSRPSLREALQKLETLGVVEHRHGSGTYVSDIFAPTITEPLLRLMKRHPDTIHDLLEFREALEGIACYQAALRANETDKKIVLEKFQAIEKAHERGDPASEAEADADFHMSIAEATHNVVLVHVMRGVFELLRDGIASSRERMYTLQGIREELFEQHREILECVTGGNAKGGWDAVHTHLKYVSEKLRQIDLDERRVGQSQRRLRQNIQ